MLANLSSILQGIKAAGSLEDIQSELFRLREELDTDHLVYHCLDASGNKYGAMTYDAPWIKRYIEMDYARVDPVIQGCFQSFHPIDWKSLDWSQKASRLFLSEALDTGVGNQGLSIPIRGPNGQFAVFSVNRKASDTEWETFRAAHMNDLLLIAHFLNQRALELEASAITPVKHLSPREADALALLAIGLNRSQISDRLKISEHTLRVYIESARFKLGATNTTHAVAAAISRGMIAV